MNGTLQKAELIKWINSIEDPSVLNEIEAIKSKEKFDFEKQWARGISINEARKKSKEFIKSLPWKK
jgi:hypothetical protein